MAAAVVDFLRGPLAEDPQRVGEPLRLRLQGCWSARRGQYRVVCSIHDDEVLVRVVPHRSPRRRLRVIEGAHLCGEADSGPAPPRQSYATRACWWARVSQSPTGLRRQALSVGPLRAGLGA
ncbi:type II toxin-antitoxin system RelE family toxin [Candidatus Blastococcus massiliensis]|uniref:type II toxin-antitoxin system RelE family toxin n=1 Tax=Candidatus Blastococcus massiliensis TaxID=1470358 RepID=UPI001E55C09B|nr:type II toxin-antitoxin system RelE/ParE family toxin [Candidatus Blastococcus massiliensis]